MCLQQSDLCMDLHRAEEACMSGVCYDASGCSQDSDAMATRESEIQTPTACRQTDDASFLVCSILQSLMQSILDMKVDWWTGRDLGLRAMTTDDQVDHQCAQMGRRSISQAVRFLQPHLLQTGANEFLKSSAEIALQHRRWILRNEEQHPHWMHICIWWLACRHLHRAILL